MADEPEDPDAAADQLEVALERIARAAEQVAKICAAAQVAQSNAAVRMAAANALPSDFEVTIPEIAERLDSLIARLRTALGKME